VSVLVILVAYLLGSIPFSFVIARRRGVDVRRVGSGNVGASNVLRSAGVAAGLLALILDVFKGILAAGIARWNDSQGLLPAIAALMVVLGHIFPVWLRFRGGKGVAVAAGAFFVLMPAPLLGSLLVFVTLVAFSRFVSVGSIGAAIALPILAAFISEPRATIGIAACVSLLILLKHVSNIVRLVRGTENRLELTRPRPKERCS
jgi:glycerol-3-phosphate acyltransferase PlsY